MKKNINGNKTGTDVSPVVEKANDKKDFIFTPRNKAYKEDSTKAATIMNEKSAKKNVSNEITKKVREIGVDQLQPHPQNEIIYGLNEDVSDLVDQIKAFGKILDALKITENYVIISGHRRWKAAKELGMLTVPCEFVSFESPEEELAALVLYNYKRIKTNEQKVREGMALFQTLSVEAVERRLANLNQNRTDMDDSSISDNSVENLDSDSRDTDAKSETGLTRDKVAEAVGIKSGRTFDRMREVLERVDELKKNGNTDDSELYIAVLNRTPSAARDLIDVPLESLTNEDREKIKAGKVAPRIFLTNIETSKDTKENSPYVKSKDEIKKMNRSIKTLKKFVGQIDGLSRPVTVHDSLDNLIADIRELSAYLPRRKEYPVFNKEKRHFGLAVAALTESLPGLSFDTLNLEICKKSVEEEMDRLKELLSVIESELEARSDEEVTE